jgi:hypothetical protein
MTPSAKDAQTLSLTTADLRVIRDIMQEVIEMKHKCRFALDDEQAKEIPHTVGMIGDLAGGDLRKGVEVLRDNHKWISKLRGALDRAAMVAGTALVTGIVAGLGGIVWLGFKVAATLKGATP